MNEYDYVVYFIFGKKYNFNNLIFEGEYLNKKRNSKGKEYFDDKLLYEVEFKNGKRNGKGKRYDNKGDIIFQGEFYKGVKWN